MMKRLSGAAVAFGAAAIASPATRLQVPREYTLVYIIQRYGRLSAEKFEARRAAQ